MGHLELTTWIDAAPESVFDLVCDIDRWSEWDAFAGEVLWTSDSPLRAGSSYKEREGKNGESLWRITEFERPGRQVHVGQMPFLGAITVEMDLIARDGGTDFRHGLDYEVFPRVRPLSWLIERVYVDRYARNGMVQTHEAAKRLLEAGS